MSRPRELLRRGGNGTCGGAGRFGCFSSFGNDLEIISSFLSKTPTKSKGGAGRGGADSFTFIAHCELEFGSSIDDCSSSIGGLGKD